jgi:parallel beta-helix repeat protein
MISMNNLKNRKSIEAHAPTVTVGPDAGMFRGADHFAIQGAVDYVARLGGGEVQILPGDYVLRNAILLSDSVMLRGCGAKSVLTKAASRTVEVAQDCVGSRWFVDVKNSEGFHVGDGITISSNLIDGAEGRQHSIHTIVGVEGQRIFLDSQPRMEHWLSGKAIVTSIHSLVEVRGAKNVCIREIHLRGNQSENDCLDGNYGAAIFMRDSENILVENVSVTDFNGDAISWQTCHDVTVENCVIRDVATLGLHPGTGSQRPIMRDNEVRSCMRGIYFCWDVNNGLAENNRVYDCREHGISLGHRDTENIVRGNEVNDCHVAGIFFRPERGADKTAHRTLVEENIVRCPTDYAEACGISVVRGVEDVVLRHNKIEIAEKHRENAIVIDEAAVRTVLENNEIKILK